jgi:hypothetical protein
MSGAPAAEAPAAAPAAAPKTASSSFSPTSSSRVPAPDYSPAPLRLLAAATAARSLHALLPSQTDAFRRCGEDDLLLLFASVVREGRLTPHLARSFEQVAVEHRHTQLRQITGALDIVAGMTSTDTSGCGSPLSPKKW